MAIDRKNVERIVEAIGGKDNIEAATHCVTRLRFALADDSKVDTKALDENDLVKGQFSSQGQFQVVIGPGLVDQVYNEMMDITGGTRASKDDVKTLASKKQNPIQRAIKTLADIFIPILPAIVMAGLLLGINNLLTGPGIFYEGQSLIQVHPEWADVASIINLIASTAFTFLPVLIGWSAVRQFGGNPLLGIVLGLILVNPDLLSAYQYADAKLEGTVPVWNLFGFDVEKIGYQGQVLPVLVSAYILAKIEKFLDKRVHDSIKLLIVAPVALLVTGFLAFILVGPITFAIGNVLTSGLVSIFDSFAALGGLIYGGLYALLVITGMHHTFLAVDFQLIGSNGGTFLWPMLALSNIAQGAAALAMMFILKEQKAKGLAVTSSISAFLGVTEPAIFGVNIRHKYPFIFGMVGSGIAGVLLAVNNVLASSIGVGGIPGFLSIFPNQWGVFFLGMAIVLVVPFTGTLLFGRYQMSRPIRNQGKEIPQDNVENERTGSATAAPTRSSVPPVSEASTSADASKKLMVDIAAPMNGKVVPLAEVPDPAFAEKQMGQGIAIIPSEGKVYAPFDGQVAHLIKKSKHAIILTDTNGVQILIHVGINTVSLKGEGFIAHVETGDAITKGQLLLEFDIHRIEQAGLPVITPIIVPDGQELIQEVVEYEGEAVQGQTRVLQAVLHSEI
ncbi:PTS trehalose transporter subunit IIBC [Paenibacillus glucanolyticus]|jgi:PTS system trehalose-specific IIC component|uniref:PTS system trehalose-specific EIIBC component n=1 Tax=Paenibacillus TaxID=44249 RepID=UPI0003E1FE90|nr:MULTISPECIES: PTS system trehalose-specific EIIBC component [Paenibacillus]ANA82487.1 PTS beta-glucoside transporter subunit EIIBCA [Paenibacillus glucanolyticus]AVV58771.1 PTS trehalose transporter subunit IIBC [Paenibacillus glucanolyticus]ETT33801.1 PTS system, trehalose-specific IIBC subunit [Paenibacillus sp. FSL R5-808]MPY17267.1 PTS trehalose transporter subunit IIBC [Paenibacillus glucanolyticus]OMF80130.1 PTS beta-glucoside transporter subunit EIIBCA [Paenibacillus glucanolyticus]